MLLVGRFLNGVGVGMMDVAVPIYQSEISPAKVRGRMVGTHGFLVVCGYVSPPRSVTTELMLTSISRACLAGLATPVGSSPTRRSSGVSALHSRSSRPCFFFQARHGWTRVHDGSAPRTRPMLPSMCFASFIIPPKIRRTPLPRTSFGKSSRSFSMRGNIRALSAGRLLLPRSHSERGCCTASLCSMLFPIYKSSSYV